MSRVEWTELGGDEAETVLANLIYSEHPLATRVRPSRGDFGIDVVTPVAGAPEVFDVYQIKRFASTLSPSQKKQVEESFRRLLIGFVQRGVPLADWYLVMPVDPTVDNLLDWFVAMPDVVIAAMFEEKDKKTGEPLLTDDEKVKIAEWRNAPGRIIKWEGRPFCETLAGKYPYVIDYYLHGGEQRLRSALAVVGPILQTDRLLPAPEQGSTAALLTPVEVRDHLLRLQEVLDTDPHFRYGVSFDPAPPEITEEPHLVAATQEIQPDGQTLTFRIYARFSESLNERPVPISLKFSFDAPAFDRDAFDEWRKYGKPLTAPVEIEADLPGGLGSALSGKASRILIHPIGSSYELRLRIRTPEGTAGQELLFAMSATTGPEEAGLWAHGTDESGFLTYENTLDVDTQRVTTGFRHAGLMGAEAAKVLPSLEFAADLRSPNVIQAAERYGPFLDFHAVPGDQALIPQSVLRYVRDLVTIQTRTATPILVPELAAITTRDARVIAEAAALINGHTVVSKWVDISFPLEPGVEIDTTGHYLVGLIDPLIVEVGDQKLTLGAVEKKLLSAKFEIDDNLVRAHPHLNDTVHTTFAPDEPVPDRSCRPVRGQDLGPTGENASPAW
ncbi:hypothetical protein [Mycobacterium vicinigordonae]|uniref:Restriction endonuclease type IV Mrr domain-containing protein n=1 Tax=Mycobacterium vicinigordonae TaxID=1719132 RepID=A0A7D6IPQ2_9MYCO|nr:hypothetical protein [Mycobacterium vicinigordonae]QLL09000.1 hypothetical protein H0P51_08965 [Mycobacterium vicinigordonae]